METNEGTEETPRVERRPAKRDYTPMWEARWQQVWELHLRGWSRAHIARETGLTARTVTRIVKRQYVDVGYNREATLEEKLTAAIERMRHVQRQAWADHDEDAEHERQVLAAMGVGAAPAGGDGAEKWEIGPVRYQSQRAQYLRVILDAEREIARLQGLYEGLLGAGATTTYVLAAICLPAGEEPNLPRGIVVDANP